MHPILVALVMSAVLPHDSAVNVPTPSAVREPVRVVGTGDLDLSSAEGRAVLDSRIRSAAQSICEQLNGPGHAVAQCKVISIQKARGQRDAQIARHVRPADARRTGLQPIS